MDSAVQFKEEKHKKMFQAMRRSDNDHVESLRRALQVRKQGSGPPEKSDGAA
jgi:hypothetical protein